jgi:phosphoribosyl-AMP cyclohydrolase
MNPNWNADGLLPAIAQDVRTGEVLMMAWMNEESLALTLAKKQAIYWSRSRQALWRKGETSGNVQTVVDARLDCDGDTLLLQVDQAVRVPVIRVAEHVSFMHPVVAHGS